MSMLTAVYDDSLCAAYDHRQLSLSRDISLPHNTEDGRTWLACGEAERANAAWADLRDRHAGSCLIY